MKVHRYEISLLVILSLLQGTLLLSERNREELPTTERQILTPLNEYLNRKEDEPLHYQHHKNKRFERHSLEVDPIKHAFQVSICAV